MKPVTASHTNSIDELLAQRIELATSRFQAGQSVDLEELAGGDADLLARLQALWPTVQAMAQLDAPLPNGRDLGQTAAESNSPEGFSLSSALNLSPSDVPSGVLGDYRIVGELGRGGMGVVYEAEQISLGRRVALKVFPFAAMLDPRALQRFKNEAQAAALVDHPNIVDIYSVGCERGVHFYAMRLIDGPTLAQVIDELRRVDRQSRVAGKARYAKSELPSAAGGGMDSVPTAERPLIALERTSDYMPPSNLAPAVCNSSLDTIAQADATLESGGPAPSSRLPTGKAFYRRVAQLGIDLAEALDHAHKQGVIHRDIKPSNLLLDARGKIWLTDLGLAHVESSGANSMTRSGDLLGTLRYMSPEQALAKRVVVDHRCDIYSLGVTLYELLTLKVAFPGRNRAEVLHKIAFEEPRSPRRLNKAIPHELETIVLKAMEKNPESRYATAQALADDLRHYLEDKPIRAKRPSLAQRTAKWSRRHKYIVRSAIAVLVVVVGGLTTLYARHVDSQRQIIQMVQQSLAGARAAIQADDLVLAGQEVSEAKGRLGEHGAALSETAAEIEKLAAELKARQKDRETFDKFVKLAHDAQGRLGITAASGAPAFARKTLAVFRIENDPQWLNRLKTSYLTTEQKHEVQELAYETLVGLADDIVRWNHARTSAPQAVRDGLVLLDLARSFHPPTRAWWFVRRQAHKGLKDEAAAQEDDLQFRGTEAKTAFDWYLPGHSAGWAGDQVEAIRSYQAALRVQPDHYPSLFFLAVYLENDLRPAEAIGYYTACKVARPHAEFVYAQIAQCRVKLGQLAEAEADLNAAFTLNVQRLKKLAKSSADPSEYEACRRSVGNALHNFGTLDRREEGEKLYREHLAMAEKLVAEFPSDTNYRFLLGGVLQNLGELCKGMDRLSESEEAYRRAQKIWELLVRESPDDKDQRFWLANLNGHFARVLSKRGQHVEAETLVRQSVDILRKLVAESPGDGQYPLGLLEAQDDLGFVLETKGALDEAIACYRAAIRLKRDSYGSQCNLARALQKKGRFEEAITTARFAIGLRNYLARAHQYLGDALLATGAVDEAIASFREGIRLKPKEAEIHNGLGQALHEKGLVDKAIDSYREAIRLKASEAEYHYNLGNVLGQKRALDESIASYQKAIDLKPEYAEAHCNLAEALLTKGDLSAALKAAQRGHLLAPSKWAVWDTLGVCQYRAGDWKAAAAALEKSIKLHQDADGRVSFFLPMTYWQLGDKDKARKTYDLAVAWMEKNQPQNPDLRRFRAEAAELMGVPSPVKAPFDAQQAKAHQQAWAKYLDTQVETTNSIGMKLVLIPPGEFLMGSTPDEVAKTVQLANEANERPWTRDLIPTEAPQHPVIITRPMLMGATEVTVAQFKKFVEASTYETEAEKFGSGNSRETTVDSKPNGLNWRAPGYAVSDESAVTQVSWNDAVAFCNWLSQLEKVNACYVQDPNKGLAVVPLANGYRLPTEAEWEYACRAGTTTQYSFGDDVAALQQNAWCAKNRAGAIGVGLKPSNPFGLYDMHGNVWEWCQDWQNAKWYESSPIDDPFCAQAAQYKVLRGGSFKHGDHCFRAAFRYRFDPTYRDVATGFRVVRSAP